MNTVLAAGAALSSLTDLGAGRWIAARPGADAWEIVAWSPGRDELPVGLVGATSELDGGTLLIAPADHQNADAVRAIVPWLRPRRLRTGVSIGFGDRLGTATPGHVAALRRRDGLDAVLGQQSARELVRMGRTCRDVVDCATIGALVAGWRHGFAADGDHSKTAADLEVAIEAGCSLLTADPIEVVPQLAADGPRDKIDEAYADVPWADLEDDEASFLARYPDVLDLESRRLALPEALIRSAAARFGKAVVRVAAMHRRVRDLAGDTVDFEVAVDEIAFATTPVDHVYLATELRRLGVRWDTFAPRFVGTFEKGIDYLGDPVEFGRDVAIHAEIARVLGPYRLSFHSASDKFSVYPTIIEGTRGQAHLKTSGTSYLAALQIIARVDPALMREIWRMATSEYSAGRTSYLVSANPDRVPSPDAVADHDLVALLDRPDSREMLHVTYGAAWHAFGPELRRIVWSNRDDYRTELAGHLGRHVDALAGLTLDRRSAQGVPLEVA